MADSVEIAGQTVELKWLWRRVLTFALIILAELMVGFIVWRLADLAIHAAPAGALAITALMWLGLALIGVILVAHLTYLTGAGVSDWAKLAAATAQGVGGVVGGLIPGGGAVKAATATVTAVAASRAPAPVNPAAKVPGDD